MECRTAEPELVRDVRDVAKITNQRQLLAAPFDEHEGRGLRAGTRRIHRQREAPARHRVVEHAGDDTEVAQIGVAREVFADGAAAALVPGNQIQPAVLGDELAQRVPVTRVEERRVTVEARPVDWVGGDGSRRRGGVVARARTQAGAPAEQRRFDRW